MFCGKCGKVEGDAPGRMLCGRCQGEGWSLTPAGIIRVEVSPGIETPAPAAPIDRQARRPRPRTRKRR